jgi:hypothetical protein
VVSHEPLQPSADAYKLNHGGKQSFIKAVTGKSNSKKQVKKTKAKQQGKVVNNKK